MLTCKYLFDNSDLYIYENKKPNRLLKRYKYTCTSSSKNTPINYVAKFSIWVHITFSHYYRVSI